MYNNVNNCKPDKKREITLLLLGESGVGKSTFINAIVNYMSFERMDVANGLICLIPVNFTITNPETLLPERVTLGHNDMNENTDDPTQSATQYPKCYTFQNNDIVLNIIDTPGIADTDGPNDARVDVVFKYCIFQLFTHLNKSAANNILFLFTNSRSTHYMPGESGPALMKILKQIRESPPNVDIPYNRSTTYCFDSESFRYLVASVPPNNIRFEPRLKHMYEDSWERANQFGSSSRSVEECRRLFNHIIQLPAHKVMDTLSLNNAKQIIQLLTKPLADITKNIADNVMQCELHRNEIKAYKGSIEELHKKLYIPSVEIISVPLDRPKTICGVAECCEFTTIDGVIDINYLTECHSPCYLDFDDGNIVGNKGLLRCKAFNIHSTTDRDPGRSRKSWFKRTISAPGGRLQEKRAQSVECYHCGH
ncbi:unnamed protein product, partial [Medioppia subpectinata]